MDIQSLVGMKIDDARQLAEENGLIVRVRNEDGVAYSGTLEIRLDRINVNVTAGVVSAVLRIG